MDILSLKDDKLAELIDNRWNSADTLWSQIEKIYKQNTRYYDCDTINQENLPEYLKKVPYKKHKVRANRIFKDMEAVINALIANPPRMNIIPGTDSPKSAELAKNQEYYFNRKYDLLNVKEILRKALRNLYFSRLFLVKVYWDNKINDFSITNLDPRKVRISAKATKEIESEFVIEEVDCSLNKLIEKFPAKKDEILKKTSYNSDNYYLTNEQTSYLEAWIDNYTIFKFKDLILEKRKNPYWDWDGILMNDEEEMNLNKPDNIYSTTIGNVKAVQDERKESLKTNKDLNFRAYKFNYFSFPRKPYIFATILNNEQRPIGRTDFISQASSLQESIDRRKMQIDENAEIINGIIKVDSQVMSHDDVQKLRFETGGIIYGKGVVNGVQRETGSSLPAFIFEDMQDSRNEIDNIMAATSAFRGEREGQETKAGRMALIEQSYLALNELVQLLDFVCQEIFEWFYQLAKIRYTERHYLKDLGENNAVKTIEISQNDFEAGSTVKIIPGKMLPEDRRFKYERAQFDLQQKVISPVDYLKEAGYQNPMELSQNVIKYQMNPLEAVGMEQPQLPLEQPMAPSAIQ